MSNRAKLTIVVVAVLLLILALGLPQLLSPPRAEDLTAGFNAEFLTRPDGYPGLVEAYDLQFSRSPRQMDTGLMYRACADGVVDVISGFATDGRIEAYDLVTLEDDKNFFPPYYAAPLVRTETLERHPQLEQVLNSLAGVLDDARMRRLNLQADRDQEPRPPEDVAFDFLLEQGLIEAEADKGDGSAGRVSVGGKDFTEQNILGEILAQLIEYNTDLEVVRRLYLGGTMICFNALRAGDLDMYVEYTGTGLVNILQQEVVSDPDKVYETVSRQFAEQYNLTWMQPMGFNNTYALTMRRQTARELGLATISDLAEALRGE